VHWLRDSGFRRAVADFLRRETVAVDRYVDSVAAHTAYHRNPGSEPAA
jgi:predicted N-acyltransferase